MKMKLGFLSLFCVLTFGCAGYQTQGGPEFDYGMGKGYKGEANDCWRVYSSGTSAFICNAGYLRGVALRPVPAPAAVVPSVAPVAPGKGVPPTSVYGYGRQVAPGSPPQLGYTGFLQ